MPEASPPRLRQAVLASSDLSEVTQRLRRELKLGEPFSDPGVGYFGLQNQVFALGDTFLEVVSPVRDDTSAGRLLSRRGADCGYMLMFQVEDLPAARERARQRGIREVFEVKLEDIAEVHLHPADMHGAIVSLSAPVPTESWRWGGPGWAERAAPPSVSGATVAVAEPEAVEALWREVVGPIDAVRFVQDNAEPGLVEVRLAPFDGEAPLSFGTVSIVADDARTPQAAAAGESGAAS